MIPHVFFSGMATGAFFILGSCAYHLLCKNADHDLFQRSFRFAIIVAMISAVIVALVGHSQAQHMVQAQLMKLAAAEASNAAVICSPASARISTP